MPSKAFNSFKYNLVDVDRLLQAHGFLNKGTQGKKGLGHITRSGVVMLCAAWEHYCESLIRESVLYLCNQLISPIKLPKEVQKEISKAVKESKNELRPLHLSGDGWMQVYIDHANVLTMSLNTPKSGQLNVLFKRVIGIEMMSTKWTQSKNILDDFVSVRGDIAHQGRRADYVTISQLKAYRDQIRNYAVETDSAISDHLKSVTKNNNKPWNVTT